MARTVKKPTTNPSQTQGIELPRFDLQRMQIRLIGDAPLICHAWSQKAKQQMLDKQTKQAKAARAAKDPMQDFLDSLYPFPGGGYGFPAIGLKSSAVDACSHVEGITKVEARGAFHIQAELVKIESGEPTMREDMVRVGLGTADIRYRGQFLKWAINVPITFNAGVLSVGQITNLFNVAGFSIGIGEWRPQRDGMFGLFHVAREGE
jgi:hypothetical protein